MRDMPWTDEQADAITAEGHVLLTASAGTGKTTTVVGKILWLLGLEAGIRASDGRPLSPCPQPCGLEEIAAITFTEKAAHDLKRKLRKEIERSERAGELRWELEAASVGTIHSFCGELLRDHALRLGTDPRYRVLDEREARLRQDEIVREVLLARLTAGDPGAAELVEQSRLAGWSRRSGAVDYVRDALRDVRWRSDGASGYAVWEAHGALDVEALERIARDAGAWPPDPEGEEAERAALRRASTLHSLGRDAERAWSAWLREENARDFDSLVLDARRLLLGPGGTAALAAIRRRFRVLIVDEFQDTDGAQRDIAFAIAGLGAGGRPPDGSDRHAAAAPPVEEGGRSRPPTPDLFLVGDPKQSVYRFRGADIAVWNRVAEVLGREGRRLGLSRNFRSDPAVVRFVNRVGAVALEERSVALAAHAPESRVEYDALVAARPASPAGGVEWLAVSGAGNVLDRREEDARRVAARALELRGTRTVIDMEDGRLRRSQLRDMAVLARTREALSAVEKALRDVGIPYYNSATPGLSDRQEVLDLVTALRLLDNPHDDLCAFAFLRSPFVGLRDEVVARIRLESATGRTSLLRQAERFREAVSAGELAPFDAPEAGAVARTEMEALGRGLEALEEARHLVDRADLADVSERLLERTGYRLHLLLRPGAREALANLDRFSTLLEDYRHLPLGSFLELWARWGDQDLGIPQAPLYSAADDVVTLSTIHAAKGLEWPIVFLIQLEVGTEPQSGRFTHGYCGDPRLGPVVMPPAGQRSDRSESILRRTLLEEHAEEARLLYVAMTRARDRLVAVGHTSHDVGYGAWLGTTLAEAAEARGSEGPVPEERGRAGGPAGAARPASAVDTLTGTGRQLDAFGFDEEAVDGAGQYSLFHAPVSGAEGAGGRRTGSETPIVWVLRAAPSVQTRLQEPPVELWWMEGLERADWPSRTRPLPRPPHSFTASATERMLHHRDPREWRLRYLHGVVPRRRFAPPPTSASPREGLPAELRGQVIHGVLERVEEEREISRLLEEAIQELGAPDLELLLDPAAGYRVALEREIAAVVRSPAWRSYVEGPHWRELPFVHIRGPREWRIGAFDLFRLAAEHGGADRVVDFKTHEIDDSRVLEVARTYAVQVKTYREAAAAIRGDAEVYLHFTRPNRIVGPELAT